MSTGARAPGGSSDPNFGCTPLEDDQQAVLSELVQGDVLRSVTSLPVIGSDGTMRSIETPNGVAIISPTCDIVISNRPAIQVAPVVVLHDPFASEARLGKRPRYAHIACLDQGDTPDIGYFADLEFVATLEKTHVAAHTRADPSPSDTSVRTFGQAIARKYGRFAFPDEVAPWLRPLEEILSSRSRRPDSPEGKILTDVIEIRIEAANSWADPPYDLTMCVITNAAALPAFSNDALPVIPSELEGWLRPITGKPRTSPQLASRLLAAIDPAECWFLWQALADSWAAKCVVSESAPAAVRTAISGVVAEVVADDEFSLSRVRRSERLDLDHLSGPTPA